ncbi:MAG: SIS domain-containing protein [Acidobacteria bacterium]|nr:MAG: SIS domain-containing protein [Acidobacteriota bacterium]
MTTQRPSSFLESEIREQPEVLDRLLQSETERVFELAQSLRNKGEDAGDRPYCFDYVVLAARGSSDNAARYAQYLFGYHNRLPVSLATASLLTMYERPPRLARALVIGISQSGQSPDIVGVLAEARRQGQATIAITNDPQSPLASAAEHLIPLGAGPEKSIAATKTYTLSLGALALLSAALENDRDRLNELHKLPVIMERTFPPILAELHRVERYRYMSHCVVIGRGFNYATAFEVALKIKELTRTITEPYSSADFHHGPIAMVHRGFPIMLVAPSGAVIDDIRQLVVTLKRLEAELLTISDDADLLADANLAFPIPEGLPEWLTPLVTVIPGQFFAMALAQARGLNADHPQGLKKVTETM